MKTIKEKPTTGKPRTLEKNVRVPPAVMRAVIERARDRVQEQTEPQEQSSSNYAIGRAGEAATDTVRMAGDGARDMLRADNHRSAPTNPSQEPPRRQAQQQAARRQTDQRREAQNAESQEQPYPQDYASQDDTPRHSERPFAEQEAAEPPQRAARQSAAKQAQQIVNETHRADVKTAEHAEKTPKQATKPTVKTVDTTARDVKAPGTPTVKTTQPVGESTERSIEAVGKGAQAAARAAEKAARKAAEASRTAVKAVNKAVVAIAKTVAAAAKAIGAWIAAGGWVILLVIIAVGAIAAILCSAFGVFFSNEADPGKLKAAIVEINTDFTNDLQSRIDSLSAGTYDAVNVVYDGDFDGDSFMVNNWTDVLGVYAVQTTTDEAAGDEVLTVTPEKQRILKSTFLDMNNVDIRTEIENGTTTAIVDGEVVETPTITLNILINIQSMTYLEGAELYGFDEDQMEMLEELMSPQYYSFFAELIDVDIYGGLTTSDFATLVNDLPAGTKGGAIAQAAASKVGTPYSVMDCSQLSQYAYGQAGVSLPRTSVEQAQYCYNNGYNISAAALQPGDLIFWSKTSCRCGRWNKVHHVGVFIGNGRIVDASSAKGRVVLRNLWSSSNWQIIMYARPHV